MKTEMERVMQEENTELLNISCSGIELLLENKEASGSFTISAGSGKLIKGKVCVSDPRMVCLQHSFQGEDVTISFSFYSSYMRPGEEISGFFTIICNLGEYEIPFTVTCPKTIISSSLGEIKNLFHFTNLAKTNWSEAVELFFQPEFTQILTPNDLEIYRGLSKKKTEQWVEEFLLAVHKKNQVTYTINQNNIHLENVEESTTQELEIIRNGWGYTQIHVETTGTFLSIEKETIQGKDFSENKMLLPIKIDAKMLHQGKNWGEIFLIHPYGKIRIEVLVYQKQHHRMRPAIEKRRNRKWLYAGLTRVYVEFRLKKMAAGRFKKECEEILEGLRKQDERNPLVKLYVAHLYISEEKYQEAKWYLDRAQKSIQEEQNTVVYAYYLYLTTLLNKESDYVARVSEVIEELYYKREENWQIAWLWMYLSKDLRSHAQKKWEYLKRIFMSGCTSPVMYTEAVLLLNYQPTLLMELGQTELRILQFGQKNGILTPQVKGIVQYLSLRVKEYSYELESLLVSLCKEDNNVELLQSLCSLCIKGNRVGSRYFPWYEKAILEGVKITKLYEYYMLSLDRSKNIDIPKMVLMYFSYQNELEFEYAAYLYRYVYENREQMEELYLAYAAGIDRFILKQLYAGKINRDLGYLYEHILLPNLMTEDNAKALANVLFYHQWDEQSNGGEKLVVVYHQLKEEQVFEKKMFSQMIPLYTRSFQLFREDKWGNRFYCPNMELSPYLPIRNVAKQIGKWTQQNLGLSLYLCDEKQGFTSITKENENHFENLIQRDDLWEKDKQEIRSQLLDFDYETEQLDLLDRRLEQILPESLSEKERAKLIYHLVVRGFYEKAYEFVKEYSPYEMGAKSLVRICTYMLQTKKGEEDILLWYLYTAYKKGKYNSVMLEFLAAKYQGSSKRLGELFCSVRDFELDTYELSERLLKQLLQTKAYIGNEVEVFKAYVSGGAKTPIEAAFLTLSAVAYLRDDKILDPYLIMDMGRVIKRGFQMPFVTHLAYLRFFAEQKELEEQADEQLLNQFLQEAVFEKELVLPFLQEYAHKPGMEALADKTILSYKTKPKSRVVIHYMKNNSEEDEAFFVREEMKEVYFGVYVKEFILFYGEEVQYYITEEQDNQEQLTQSGVLQREVKEESKPKSRYQMLQELSLAKTMEDYTTADHLLEEYWQTEFITQKVFLL